MHKQFSKHMQAILRLHTSPHEIALGFSVGTFIALLPTPGLSILIGFLIMLVYENISKISLVGALALWNPLVQIPMYYLAYTIGGLFLSSSVIVDVTLAHRIFLYSLQFVIGSIITASVLGVVSYVVVRFIAQRVQDRRRLSKVGAFV